MFNKYIIFKHRTRQLKGTEKQINKLLILIAMAA